MHPLKMTLNRSLRYRLLSTAVLLALAACDTLLPPPTMTPTSVLSGPTIEASPTLNLVQATNISFDAVVAKHATVLVDFETPWCAPCKRMAPRVEAIAAARGLQLLRVDIDASEALAVREDVVGVPVLALYRDGKRVWRHAGELDEAALAAALTAATGG